jgi:hypothetical protein
MPKVTRKHAMSDVVPGGIRFSTKHTDLCFPSFFACYPSFSLRSVTHEEIIMTRERLQILSSLRQ